MKGILMILRYATLLRIKTLTLSIALLIPGALSAGQAGSRLINEESVSKEDFDSIGISGGFNLCVQLIDTQNPRIFDTFGKAYAEAPSPDGRFVGSVSTGQRGGNGTIKVEQMIKASTDTLIHITCILNHAGKQLEKTFSINANKKRTFLLNEDGSNPEWGTLALRIANQIDNRSIFEK